MREETDRRAFGEGRLASGGPGRQGKWGAEAAIGGRRLASATADGTAPARRVVLVVRREACIPAGVWHKRAGTLALMLARGVRTAVLCAGLLAVPAVARGSERSQRLVAQAEVAYAAGRYEEAEALFREAVADDAQDVDARYALGLTYAKLDRWEEAAGAFQQVLAQRPGLADAARALELARERAAEGEAPARQRFEATRGADERQQIARPGARQPWEIHASTGFEYDSNVVLAPRGHARGGVDDRGDEAFLVSAGGRYDVLDREDALVRVEYDFYQTLHLHIDDFDFSSHRPRATAACALLPELWVGAQVGYNYYTLGDHGYLNDPYVMPYVSYVEGGWGLTQLIYRHDWSTYLSRPFHEVRDGETNAAGVGQTFYARGGSRYLTLGYQYEGERPYHTVGADWRQDGHQAYVGVGFPAWLETAVDLLYLYRFSDYTEPNSFAAFRKSRDDDEHHMFASVRRALNEHLSLGLAYYGTVNESNIAIFDYRRSVVSALLQVSY